MTNVTQFHNRNQFLIEDSYNYTLQSYDSQVALFNKHCESLTLCTDWDYSKTTLKHVYLFIDEFCTQLSWYKLFVKSSNKRKCLKNLIDKGYIQFCE